MSNPQDVAVLVGSLRKESFNRKLAKALIALAPPPLKLEIIEIGNLPLYNQDLDASPPPEWTAFRDRVRRADAVLFITPEYNRSVPAPMKNAIDVGSRPYGSSVWDGKPGGVISASPGAVGGFGANHHLRQSLVFLTCRSCSSPRPISAVRTSCSMNRAASRTLPRESSWASIWRLTRAWIERNAAAR